MTAAGAQIDKCGGVYVLSKSEEYRRDAQRARIQAESARLPQEKEMAGGQSKEG
jgi:hypothetical protein